MSPEGWGRSAGALLRGRSESRRVSTEDVDQDRDVERIGEALAGGADLQTTLEVVLQVMHRAAGVEGERGVAALASLQDQISSLESRAGALSVIRQATDAITAAGSLDDVLAGIVRNTARLLGTRRGSIMLIEPGGRLMRMHAAVGVSPKVIEKARTEVGRGIAGRCAATGEATLIRDVEADRLRSPSLGERKDEYRAASAICVPIKLKREILGVLSMTECRDGRELGPRDLFVAQIVANQAAIAIWNRRLREEAVAAAEAHQALGLAREIQQSFIPDRLGVPGIDVCARSVPRASGAGGDYVDYWLQCDEDDVETGRIVLAIGDVSGHGVDAALVMATTRAFLRGLLAQSVRRGRDLAKVMERLNGLIGRDMRRGRFVTLFVGILDPRAGTLVYASAGHDPPLLHRSKAGAIAVLDATGPPLGIASQGEWAVGRDSLAPGDLLVMTTDGVWEVRNRAGEIFGRERLTESVRELAGEPAAGVVTGLQRRAAAFAGPVDPGDDVSLLVIRLEDRR